jgi:hypothetical protein
MCGMTGAVCSRDGVYFATDRAKSQQRHLMVGKEGYPTWGYDCVVSHTRQILEVVGPFRGNTNDKTMVRSSDFVRRLGTDPLLACHEYHLLTGLPPPNNKQVMKGLHCINDGGHHRWPTIMNGPKSDEAPTPSYGQYGRHTESMRKDVECAFGILKKRSRICRLPFLIMKRSTVDNIIRTCIIMHNMLLQYDGLDIIGDFDDDYKELSNKDVAQLNTQDTDTGELPPDAWLEADIMAEDVRVNLSTEEQMVGYQMRTPVTINTDTTSVNYEEQDPSKLPEMLPGFVAKLDALCTHLDCRFQERSVRWLKTAKECRPFAHRPVLGCPGPWSV